MGGEKKQTFFSISNSYTLKVRYNFPIINPLMLDKHLQDFPYKEKTKNEWASNNQSSIPFEIDIKLPHEIDITQKVDPKIEVDQDHACDWIVIELKFKNEKDDNISCI